MSRQRGKDILVVVSELVSLEYWAVHHINNRLQGNLGEKYVYYTKIYSDFLFSENYAIGRKTSRD